MLKFLYFHSIPCFDFIFHFNNQYNNNDDNNNNNNNLPNPYIIEYEFNCHEQDDDGNDEKKEKVFHTTDIIKAKESVRKVNHYLEDTYKEQIVHYFIRNIGQGIKFSCASK